MSSYALQLVNQLLEFTQQICDIMSSDLKDKENKTSVEDEQMYALVSDYYGKVLQSKKDLKTNACCTSAVPHITIRKALKLVPEEIMDKYYGCGNPIPFGIENLTVLDLGSGSGRDCYVASNLVGEKGKVIGVDMTDEQIQVANKYVEEYCKKTLQYQSKNLEFRKGYIENLSDKKGANVDNESVDVVISNCVVNLSPNKEQVMLSVWKALKWGGEFHFSDVYSDRRLSEEARTHPVLIGECLGGALYVEDFRRICQRVGFQDPRILSKSEIEVKDEELKKVVGNAKFLSITYRLFKHPDIEDRCEDYGQVAIYKGTITEHPNYYDLDDHHRFITNKPMLVCGNSAAMVGSSWLKSHFKIIGDRSIHYGLFDCGGKEGSSGKNQAGEKAGGCCA